MGFFFLSSAASFVAVSGKEELVDEEDEEDKEKNDNNDHKDGDEDSEAEENLIETVSPG